MSEWTKENEHDSVIYTEGYNDGYDAAVIDSNKSNKMTLNEAYKILEWTVPGRHGLYNEDEFDQYCEDCENLTKAQETLYNYINKYKWHDLRLDKDDLPKEDGRYYTYSEWFDLLNPDPDSEAVFTDYTITDFDDGRWLTWSGTVNTIAWREIEPFNFKEKDNVK